MAMGKQFAALEDRRGFLKMARNVLTGDLQLLSNALRSFLVGFFSFLLFYIYTVKKIILNRCTGYFSFQ